MAGEETFESHPPGRVRRCSGLSIAFGAAMCAIFVSPLFGELPAARITGVFPPGGQAGSSLVVTVSGSDLDGPVQLRFSHPGISAVAADDSQGGSERKFKVVIDSATPVGICDVRVAGYYGVSNPRCFSVSDRPEITAAPGKPDERRKLSLDSIVNARCTNGVVDSYEVGLTKGQRVLFTCASSEIDSKLSPVMTLLDPDGHEVERSRHGGLVDFTAPADGTYVLQLHDLLYRGGPEFFYRLEAGTGPHVDTIYPPAGRLGSRDKYTLIGRNLPGGKRSELRTSDGKLLEELEVEIALPDKGCRTLDSKLRTGIGGWTTDATAYRLQTENGWSNPVLIGLTHASVVREREPNNDPATALRVEPPADVVGRFYPHGDRDWVSFDAVQGEEFWIEMCCQRMGLPSSPLVLVQQVLRSGHDEKVADVLEIGGVDANPVGPTFRTSNREGAARLQVRQTGTYRLLLRDVFDNTRDDPSLTYRLSIRRPHPDFRVLAVPLPEENNEVGVWSAFLRRGGAVPIRLLLARQDGFNGPVRVDVEGLPAGVRCSGTTIQPGQNLGVVVVTAEDDVADWCGAVRIVGRADINDEQVVREARSGVVIWPANPNAQEPAVTRLTEDLALAVSAQEQSPVSFGLSDAPSEVTVGGKATIPFKIRRNLAINGPIKMRLVGTTAPNAVKEVSLAPNVSDGSLEIDLSQQKLSPGTYSFFLRAQAQATYERRTVPPKGSNAPVTRAKQSIQTTSYSPLITLHVVPQDKAKEKT